MIPALPFEVYTFTQTARKPPRSHGQSWSAVELEDSSAQKRLMAMGNIIDADLNPDPIKVLGVRERNDPDSRLAISFFLQESERFSK